MPMPKTIVSQSAATPQLLRSAGRSCISSAATILTDPHFAAREMVLRRRTPDGWEVPMSGVVPKFSRTPGSIDRTGPELGEHTADVLGELAGVDEEELASLVQAGAV